MSDYLIKQLEAYNRTLGRPRLRTLVRNILRRGAINTVIGVILVTTFVLLSQLANPLAHRAMAAAYKLYLEEAPLQAVRFFSDDEANWLGDIRRTPCIAYEANTWAELQVYGRVLSLAQSEYKKCWDTLKRPNI